MTQSPPHRSPDYEPPAGSCPGKRLGPGNEFIPFPDEAVEGTIPERFEGQAARYPDLTAIQSRGRMYTYDEVNRSANRLAHAILSRTGEGSGPVALYLEQGAPPIIAILGVLKAGRAYVPIDAGQPPGRTSFIYDDSRAGLIVTNNRNLAAVRGFIPAKTSVINMDEMDARLSEENPLLAFGPDMPVAIIYTSGSTGNPKGVLSTHRTVLHAIKLRTNLHHIRTDDRLGFLYSYSIGASRGEIFGALLNGAAVFPFDISTSHPQKEGLGNLAGWLILEKITTCTMAATVFRHFIATLTGGEVFSSLRLMTIGGETVHPQDVDLFRKHFPETCLLRVGLGMTEACSAVTTVFIDRTTGFDGDILPAGYPLDDFEILILDEKGQPVGPGHAGEIAVKSRYLSPGYWRRPELTARQFLDCPDEDDLRIYLTGDLGRMTTGGCLYHLGRKDFQVKVRGHRIEMAEIEKALSCIEGITNAAVAAHPDDSGENRLVAYVECDRTSPPAVTGLRASLEETLPDYMIPSHFLFMDRLPRTPSGKTDRQALPVPDAARPESEASFVPPRTSTERRLADIWAEALQVSPVGITDTFFDLGGHSLTAARMFARVQREFGRSLPVSVLLQASTIEKLAALLSETGEAKPWATLVPIRAEGSRPPLFFVHDLTGDVLFYTDLVHHLGPEQPFYGIRARGLDGVTKPLTRIEDMAAHYIESIRSVQPEGPYLIGGMCFGGVVAFEIAGQLMAADQDVGLLVLLDSPCPPIDWIHHTFFRLRRYAWHAREDILRMAGRGTGGPSRLRRRGVSDLMTDWRTTVRILRVDRAHHRALQNYQPRQYSGEIIHFLRGQSSSRHSRNIRMKWDRYAPGRIDVHNVPGDHHTMLREPNVRILAGKLKEHLAGMRS